jgi:hypothetical protein
MKVCPVGAELFHADGQTNKHDEGKRAFFAILQTRLKIDKNIKGLKYPIVKEICIYVSIVRN